MVHKYVCVPNNTRVHIYVWRVLFDDWSLYVKASMPSALLPGGHGGFFGTGLLSKDVIYQSVRKHVSNNVSVDIFADRVPKGVNGLEI